MSASTTPGLMLILLRSINARVFKRHTLHSTLVSRLRVSPFQKFHATDLFNATHRDAMRRAPRPVGQYQKFRRRFDNLSSNYLLYGILGINGAVFATWSYVQMFQVRSLFPLCPLSSRSALQSMSYRPPSAKWLARWLQDNFINSYENLRNGRLCVFAFV